MHGRRQVECIDITHENVLSWPAESPLVRGTKLALDPTRPGGAQAGDRIYLAKRKKIPEVGREGVKCGAIED